MTGRVLKSKIIVYRYIYNLTQIIGHIAKSKKIKAILAPSAQDRSGKNLIFFEELP